MKFKFLRKFIREEIGRNYHTVDNSPYTFDDFADYNVEINGHTAGGFDLIVYYKDKRICPLERHHSYDDAQHASRMIIDNDRVKRMNNEKKEEDTP